MRNFNSEDDKIDLTSWAGIDSYADVRAHLTQSGNHVVFTYGNNSLRIEWQTLGRLDSDDFIW